MTAPIPLTIPETHLRALTVLCEQLPLSTCNWALTGSLGHRLQGVDVPVHDIDVQTDTDGATTVAQMLPVAISLARHGRLLTGLLLGAGAVVYTAGGLLIFAMGPISAAIQPTEVVGAAAYTAGFTILSAHRRRFSTMARRPSPGCTGRPGGSVSGAPASA